jgi:uncharacterized RDD family membrane protein YckC
MDKTNPYSSPTTPIQEMPETELSYAGFWLRFVAMLIDGIVMVAGVFLAGILLYLAASPLGIEIPEMSKEVWEAIVNVIDLLVNWLYFTLLESSAWQATLGKRAVGIKVTDLQGDKIGFGRANARYWSKILSAILLFIGFLMAAFTEKKQALHDLIAGTLVIKA